MSKEMVVIVDESKLALTLGKRAVPIEILPFGYKSTLHQLNILGYRGAIRHDETGKIFITENHNLIYDVSLPPHRIDPEKDHPRMISIPGVIETGFFMGLAKQIVVGYQNGTTELQTIS